VHIRPGTADKSCHQIQQEHSESANSTKAEMSTKKWSRIQIWINPHPDVWRIDPKMLWIHCLVGVVDSPSFTKIGRQLFEKS